MSQFQKPTREQLINRFKHHAPKGDQAQRYEQVRAAILEAATKCVDLTPVSAEQTRALNALQEAMMLFNASIAINGGEDSIQEAVRKGSSELRSK